MTQMKKYNVGLIGCGEWAKRAYLPALQDAKDYQISALSGTFPIELGRKMSSELGIGKYFEKWEDMLEDNGLDLDLVIISTPHAFHYEQAKRALSEGINVHIDKPPATSLKELSFLIKIAKKYKVSLTVHTQMRCYPVFSIIKNLIETGKIGDVYMASGFFEQRLFDDYQSGWRSDNKLSCGGMTMDSGYHIVDLVEYLLGDGKIKNIHSLLHNCGLPNDAASAIIYNHDKTLVQIKVVRGVPKHCEQEGIEIYGSKGYVLASKQKTGNENNYKIAHYDTKSNIETEFTDPLNPESTHKQQPLLETLQSIRNNNEETMFNAIYSKSVVKILEKTYSQQLSRDQKRKLD